jgi:beta-glucanase (GH16 family)
MRPKTSFAPLIPVIVIFLLLVPLMRRAQPPQPGAALPVSGGWKLVFSDEFDGSKLDQTKWNTCYPWVEADGGCTNSGNNEMEWYQPDEVFVEDGLLRLRAQERSVKEGFPYTSGMVTSHERFAYQYGYIESRQKMPAGKGLWPAFWLLPEEVKWPPEIDILEVLGHAPTTVHTTVHFTTDGKNHLSQGSSYSGPNFAAEYHTFGLLWEPNLLVWYVDGVERFSVEREGVNVPSEPFYILINLAVGGNWPGAPDKKTQFPAFYEIDYVRVWLNEPYMATAAAPTPTPSGGKNILHVGKITAVDEDGKPAQTFAPGLVAWKAQVVNQDGVPVRDATVIMTIENADGSFRQRVYAWTKSDRFGWALFSAPINTPGAYTLRVDKISSLSESNPEADAPPITITVK